METDRETKRNGFLRLLDSNRLLVRVCSTGRAGRIALCFGRFGPVLWEKI